MAKLLCGVDGGGEERGRIVKDITGERFGRLVAVEFVGLNKYKWALWRCACDCGNDVVVVGSHLRSGHTKSCGCYKIDMTSERAKRMHAEGKFKPKPRVKHGDSLSPLYREWSHMKERCYYVKNKDYKSYGGKGIAVCDEWKNDYSAFKQWAEENGYERGLELDRIDGTGDYSPENCRWADRKTQMENRRVTIFIELDGEKKTMKDWCKELGINYNLVHGRYYRGWPVEDLFKKPGSVCSHRNLIKKERPSRKRAILLTVDGKTRTITQWAEQLGVNRSKVRNWVRSKGEEETEIKIGMLLNGKREEDT